MKQVGFEKINNKDVFNILTEPEKKTNKLVVMSHGFRGTSIGPARSFVDFETELLKEGFSVLRFDQPNGGNSEGEYVNSSFNEWVDTTTYFAKKYLDMDYKVALLGQSMGATVTVVASARAELTDKIECLILWVPDPKSTFNKNPDQIYEEAGQKYPGTFWQEASDSDFFSCLEKFKKNIHLVYGERDKYISEELRNKVMDKVKKMGHEIMMLPGQDHGSWKFDVAQKVYQEGLIILKNSFN